GLIHAGGSFGTQSLTIANTAVADGYSEGLNALVSGSSGAASFGGSVITNRSVFVDEASWYEMLFISTATRAEVEAELTEIDQGQGLVRLGPPLGQTSPVAPVTPLKPVQPSAGTSAGDTASDPGAPSAKAASARPAATSSNVIRVPGEMLDHFMNQIGEMVLVRGQLAHVIADQRIREMAMALRRVSDRLPPELAGSADMQRLLDLVDEQTRRLQETDALIQGALSRLQDSVMGLRVVPAALPTTGLTESGGRTMVIALFTMVFAAVLVRSRRLAVLTR
ncbi:MAG: hypothetical protein EBY80_05395, partial [Actinobacteria bacterium]|nr:hypothetical protein [Actinomycetota bacterium]